MARYIPMPAYSDAMPVDISFVFEDEKPAGKHGFMKVLGEEFVFEDGAPARFWGTNFNGGACFPSHEYSLKVAARLAQSGCNIVRFHQLDAEWDTPNIIGLSKGKRVSTTRTLDPKSLDALDYLVWALKEQGIYCYLDMMTYRHFKEEDGVEAYQSLHDSAKPYSNFDRRLIELQKEFATQLWTHCNPYTGLCYKDDPVFVMSEITNECDLFVKGTGINVEPYASDFRRSFGKWLGEKGIDYDWENCDLYAKDAPLIDYKIDVTKAYYAEMYDHMRSIGVKIPITGTNWTRTMGLCKAHGDMDYTDSHYYFYDWRWGNIDRVCPNKSCIGTGSKDCAVMLSCSRMSMVDKPFFVSEWDMPWPNSCRAESPVYYAAIGALQGWSGFAIHTYSYGTRLDEMKILGREGSSPIGGVPYREGIFSTWNDPAKFGLFYHAAIITRRGDVAPSAKKYAVKTLRTDTTVNTAVASLLERSRVKTYFGDDVPAGYDDVIPEDKKVPCETPLVISDTGEMWRNPSAGVGGIDTPKTKAVYGQLSRGRTNSSAKAAASFPLYELRDMSVRPYTDFGVIACSSLTDDPISSSKNMLLTAIGRARNTDMQFDGDKLVDIGKAPILAEVIEADISIKTDIGDKLTVWGVNAEGCYAGKCESSYADGVFTFRIGDEMNPACYYLIVAE